MIHTRSQQTTCTLCYCIYCAYA